MSGMVMLSRKRNEIQTIIKPQRKDRRNCKMSAININENNFKHEVMDSDKPVLLDCHNEDYIITCQKDD